MMRNLPGIVRSPIASYSYNLYYGLAIGISFTSLRTFRGKKAPYFGQRVIADLRAFTL